MLPTQMPRELLPFFPPQVHIYSFTIPTEWQEVVGIYIMVTIPMIIL